MSLAESYDSNPDPLTIDPRPCSECGLTIDKHRRIDTPEGPEFACVEIDVEPEAEPDAEIQRAATLARLRMELNDPRDREMARRELASMDVADELIPEAPRSEAEPPPVDSMDAYGSDPVEPVAIVTNQPPAPARPLLVCPPAWRDVPLEPMRWLATNRIPAADVTILSGDGGGGKTTVALQLAVSVERALGDWLGTTCEAGPVIFFSGEEPEPEMRRRLHRVARKRGLEPVDMDGLHFHFADPDTCMLGIAQRDGTMAPGPLFAWLAAVARDIRPALIVVDSIAATFGGNQNDRVHARTFVGLFRTLARDIGCAILLLDHPSLAGITSGTGRGGSMDWQNATRARLHLETVEGEDGSTGRVLEVKKTNYGPCGEKVRLQWGDGCFVLQGTASAPHQAAANTTADQRYLECLDAVTTQGRHVCPGKGRGYAPKAFADMPQASGMTARAFQAAQERLFAAGTIEVTAYGPPSKGAKCIARRA
jgi:RecA-family ATPase